MQLPSSSFALRLKLNALLFVQPGNIQTPGGAYVASGLKLGALWFMHPSINAYQQLPSPVSVYFLTSSVVYVQPSWALHPA